MSDAPASLDRVEPAARGCLQAARRVVALTGSGISADSGVPTFRDAQVGLWARYRAEELATPQAFERDPELVLDWYRWRRELVARARPNAAHAALTRLAARPAGMTLVTQNVDGLHQRAGSRDVIELHGNLLRDRCSAPDCRRAAEQREPPQRRCRHCDALLRPDVVWFGESVPAETHARGIEAAADCDVFLSIGTSSLVYPAAGLAETALAAGARVIEINTAATPLSPRATHVLRGPAAKLLPALVDGL